MTDERRRWLLIAIVGCALATVAFAALWLVERADHRPTADELAKVTAEASELNADLRAEEKLLLDNQTLIRQMTEKAAALHAELEPHRNCVDASTKFQRAARQEITEITLRLVHRFCP